MQVKVKCLSAITQEVLSEEQYDTKTGARIPPAVTGERFVAELESIDAAAVIHMTVKSDGKPPFDVDGEYSMEVK